MISSMTGFASAAADVKGGRLTWELRSVNGRFLEVLPRMPEDLRSIEPPMRELVAGRLSRGRVECTLRWQTDVLGAPVAVNEARVTEVLRACSRLTTLAPDGLANPSTLDVLRWPGVLEAPPADIEGVSRAALDLLGRALDELIQMRGTEGARTRDFLLARVVEMEAIVAEVSVIAADLPRLQRERLVARIAELGATLDPARLEQEVALLAQRADVAEELARLHSHFAEIRKTLAGKGPVGRRLDFLIQELNREANTLGSKAVDMRLTTASVELKVRIEQMREQVQNLE